MPHSFPSRRSSDLSAGARCSRWSMPEPVWRPKLVALDIDGTLLRWVADSGTVHGEVPPAVRDAVRRAYDAGAHIVLASGRSLHGMTPIRSEEHTSELQSLMRISYAVFCLKK